MGETTRAEWYCYAGERKAEHGGTEDAQSDGEEEGVSVGVGSYGTRYGSITGASPILIARALRYFSIVKL